MVDEQFQMLALHVDAQTKKRIRNFEYVDFAKLLPKDKVLQEDDHRLVLVNKGGQGWLAPAADTEVQVISSYIKWHQAFRIYSEILTAKYPHKAHELLLYEHTIHTASLTYAWSNVYNYDKVFRIHISEFPDWTWAVILSQAYNTNLKDKHRQDNYLQRGAGPSKGEVCRRFQRGKCNFGLNCKYNHRCNVCTKFGHGAHICRKKLKMLAKEDIGSNQDPDQGAPQTDIITTSPGMIKKELISETSMTRNNLGNAI